jgi:5'(3')-deoxyribonucleotidase
MLCGIFNSSASEDRLIKEGVRSLEMLSGSRYVMNAAQNSNDS